MTDPRDGERVAALEAIYDSLPPMRCGGKCWDSCGPIDMTALERRRIKANTGQEIPPGVVFNAQAATACPQLSWVKRCSIYEFRPLICRLWGLTEILKCPYGCRPEGGFLSEEDAYVLINRVMQISGDRRAVEESKIREVVRAGRMVHFRDRLRRPPLEAGLAPRAVTLGGDL